MQTTPRDVAPKTIPAGVALAAVAIYGGLVGWVIVMLGPHLPRYGEFAPVLVPVGVAYPFAVASLSRRSGSGFVTALGALIPTCAAAIVGVRAPYTWRDIVAPLVIGAIALVAIWIADELLDHVRARRFGRLAIIAVLVLLVVVAIVAFIGTLLLMSGRSSAPF